MIFVDTSFWIALRNQRDQHHADARSLLKATANKGLVTSNHVRGETWTYLRRRVGHGGAVALAEKKIQPQSTQSAQRFFSALAA